MIVIDRNAIRIHELAWLVASLAELGHERSAIIAREYLHSIVVEFDDEQETSMMVERQASGDIEQAISIAMFLGANRELDSSISIKSIVSHLFQTNLTVTPSQRRRDILNLHKPLEPTKRSRRTRSDNETTNEGKNSTTNKLSLCLTTTLTHEPHHEPQANLSFRVDWCSLVSHQCVHLSQSERSRRQSLRRRGTSKEREDLEQELVRNHRHR